MFPCRWNCHAPPPPPVSGAFTLLQSLQAPLPPRPGLRPLRSCQGHSALCAPLLLGLSSEPWAYSPMSSSVTRVPSCISGALPDRTQDTQLNLNFK